MTRSRLSTVALLAGASSAALAAAGTAYADSSAGGSSSGSPGLLSGNSVQAPVEVPVDVCGNSANGVGALNPAFGNKCANVSSAPAAPVPTTPRSAPVHHLAPPPEPVRAATPTVRHEAPPPLAAPDGPQLAETGAGPAQLAAMSGLGAVLLAGGAMLLRRGRRTSE
ncbi:chaplin [Phaeacidiphilus oryzae]|uniref:chaplin n=1 Tax=Phaeacidiphilus oryzae TaxID=348818 RepID=UPI00055A2952|nr:chaplin family protein [Phaeacidiphilus oryzae]